MLSHLGDRLQSTLISFFVLSPFLLCLRILTIFINWLNRMKSSPAAVLFSPPFWYVVVFVSFLRSQTNTTWASKLNNREREMYTFISSSKNKRNRRKKKFGNIFFSVEIEEERKNNLAWFCQLASLAYLSYDLLNVKSMRIVKAMCKRQAK